MTDFNISYQDVKADVEKVLKQLDGRDFAHVMSVLELAIAATMVHMEVDRDRAIEIHGNHLIELLDWLSGHKTEVREAIIRRDKGTIQ